MITYIRKKMIFDWKETIGNIIFASCMMAVLTVCCHVAVRIRQLVKNDWYKTSLEVASMQDSFIREKMGVILWMILILVGIIFLFCLVLYALKLKLDVIKEQKQISVFQVLGYPQWRRSTSLWFGKLMELLIALFVGTAFAYGIWKWLCNQKTFFNLMTMMNENIEFEIRLVWINFVCLAVWAFLVIFWVIKKKMNLVDMLKGAES